MPWEEDDEETAGGIDYDGEDDDTPTLEELRDSEGDEDDYPYDDDPDEEQQEGAAPPPSQQQPPAPAQRSAQEYEDHIRNLNGALGKYRGEMKRLRDHYEGELSRREQRVEKILAAVAAAQGVDVADLVGEEGGQAPQVPDAAVDPAGHIVGKVGELLRPVQQKVEQLEARREQEELAAHIGEVKQYHESDTARFEAEHPDYDEAERFVAEALHGQLRQSFAFSRPDLGDEDLDALASQALTELAARVQVSYAAQRKSLAAQVYQQAQALGWRPRGAAAPQAARRGGGRRGPADSLRERMQGGASLAGLRGRPRAGLDVKALLSDDLSDDEFDAMVAGADWQRLAEAVAGE